LSSLTAIRNKLIKAVNDSGLKRVRILDSCPPIELTNGDNTVSRIEKLRKVTAPDGVHFTRVGYLNIVKNCETCFSTIAERDASSSSVVSQRTHYWRGFRSRVGATALMVASSCSGKFGRGANQQNGRGAWKKTLPPVPKKDGRKLCSLFCVMLSLFSKLIMSIISPKRKERENNT
jgi:hypothetical protein